MHQVASSGWVAVAHDRGHGAVQNNAELVLLRFSAQPRGSARAGQSQAEAAPRNCLGEALRHRVEIRTHKETCPEAGLKETAGVCAHSAGVEGVRLEGHSTRACCLG